MEKTADDYVTERARTISGGVRVKSDTIACGGGTRVVGENTKWMLMHKLTEVVYATSGADAKAILKIVGLSLPLTFGRKVYYDDSGETPVCSEEKSKDDIHKKAVATAVERLDYSVDRVVEQMVTDGDIIGPLFYVLGDIVKFLAVYEKRHNKDEGRIKISPAMAETVNKIWDTNNYFKYVINSDRAPATLIELIIYMLDIIAKKKPRDGLWREPVIVAVEKPGLSREERLKLKGEFEQLREAAVKLASDAEGTNVVKIYVMAILEVETKLSDHVESIEKYYIQVAKNFVSILESLKTFLK